MIIPAAENKNEDAPDPIVNSQPEQAENKTSDDPSAVTNPVPAAQEQAKVAPVQEDWKELLDKNLESWQAESAEARAKSESTRLRIEEERVKEAKRIADEEKALERKLQQEKEDAEVEKKVKALLASPSSKGKKALHPHHHEGEMDPKRWNDVRNAWEIIRGGATTAVPAHAAGRSEFEEEEPVEVDGRDMTAGDHGGRDGNKAAEVLRVRIPVIFLNASLILDTIAETLRRNGSRHTGRRQPQPYSRIRNSTSRLALRLPPQGRRCP